MTYWPYWSLRSELTFIDGLGFHTRSQCKDLQTRYELLLRYKEGLRLRKVWDDMPPGAVMAHLNHRITEIEDVLANKTKEKP